MFKKLVHNLKTYTVLIAAVTLLSGCTGVGSIDSPQSLGLGLPPEPATSEKLPAPVKPGSEVTEIPEKPVTAVSTSLNADLPTGPKDTGQYPEMTVAPQSRLGSIEQGKIDSMIAQMRALNTAKAAGSISTDAYAKRLAELRKLAANHSPEMLKRIEANRE